MKKMKPFGALVVLVMFFAVTPAFAVTSDYTNYWAFDDAGGRSVSDTGGQNGAMYGTSAGFGWAGGKAGTALGMDGTAQTGVALPNAILSGSQGSLSVWFTFNDFSSQNVIFSAKSSTDNNVFAALSVDHEGRPQLVFRTDPSGANRKAQIGAVLNKNEWYHMVFVATGQSYKAYLNGEEKIITGENIGRWFPDFTNQTLSYRIGASEANPQIGSWNGMLDELRIYKRALSLEEATQLYSEGNSGTPTVPLALRPKLNFTLSSDSVMAGGAVTLTWSTEKVDTCTADGNWSGTVSTSGTIVKSNLISDQVYMLSCKGRGGTVDATVRVIVGSPTQGATTTVGTLTATQMPITASPLVVMPAGTGSFRRNLTVGVRGEDVKMLQAHLIREGFLASGLTSGYFGQLTKAGLIKLQVKLGLPSTGFFGPMTRAKLSAVNN